MDPKWVATSPTRLKLNPISSKSRYKVHSLLIPPLKVQPNCNSHQNWRARHPYHLYTMVAVVRLDRQRWCETIAIGIYLYQPSTCLVECRYCSTQLMWSLDRLKHDKPHQFHVRSIDFICCPQHFFFIHCASGIFPPPPSTLSGHLSIVVHLYILSHRPSVCRLFIPSPR